MSSTNGSAAGVTAPDGAEDSSRNQTSSTSKSAPHRRADQAAESIRRHLPELAAFSRWIVRDAAKAPLHPAKLHAAGAGDRRIWCPLDHALTVWRTYPKRVAGIGFVLSDINVEHPDLRLIGIDIDKAFDEFDAIKPWARRVVDAAGSCYWERSPSGIGLRGFMSGSIPAEMSGQFNDPKARPFALDSGGVELYDGRSQRYLTVTGACYAIPA